jgi:hypothetical protein
MFAGADENTRKAMMKSMQESGGTSFRISPFVRRSSQQTSLVLESRRVPIAAAFLPRKPFLSITGERSELDEFGHDLQPIVILDRWVPDGDFAHLDRFLERVLNRVSCFALPPLRLFLAGTHLSTNWEEVSKKKVDITPPSGMDAKKWEQ